MADKNNENNKVTAEDLLNRINSSKSRLKSGTAQQPRPEAEKETEYAQEMPLPDQGAFDGAEDEFEQCFTEAAEEADAPAPEETAYEEEPEEAYEAAEDAGAFDEEPIYDIPEPLYEEEPEETEEEEYDEQASFESLVSEVTGDASDDFDESDISLMVALGMEDELAKSMGEEHAARVTSDYVAEQEEWVDMSERYEPGEYSDFSQSAEIARRYAKKDRLSLIRMLAAILLFVGIAFYENLPVLGYQVSGIVDPAVYPFIYVMVDLQLVLFLAALAFPSVTAGVKSFAGLRLTSDTIVPVVLAAAVVNSLHTALTLVPGTEPRLFNLPAALCLLMAVIGEYMTNKREIFSFNVVSSKQPKYVMRRLNTKESRLENQAVASLDEYDDENSGDIVKIAKTDFVDGYFWRTNSKSTADKPFVGLVLLLTAVLSVIIAVYTAFSQDGLSPVAAGLTAFTAALPAAALLTGFYPFYRANRSAYYNDCTIVGEASVEEYSDTEVISFDDVNVFPSTNVKVRNIRLFNNSRIDKVLYYAASVFSATGGPLADVFEVATMETGHSEDVQILKTGSGFIKAMVNGKEILFGRADSLAEHGVTVPASAAANAETLTEDCSVMYMIYQKRLVAEMTVSYVIDGDFEYILRQLTNSGMYVCVKTFDPNIDEDIINRQVKEGKYPLRVIKYRGTEEITKYAEHTDGGIVSRGTTKALLHTISYCDKIMSAKRTGYVFSVVAAILSVVVMCVLLITGQSGGIYSLYMAANQLFWLIPALLGAKLIVD